VSYTVNHESFLYQSIEDATGTVKAIDRKSGIMMAFIGSVIFALVRTDIGTLSCLTIFTTLWGIASAVAFIYTIVLPNLNLDNEIENFDMIMSDKDNRILFSPAYIRDIDNYYQRFTKVSTEDLVKILLFERLKLQVLIDRKTIFFKLDLYWGTLPFLVISMAALAGHI
jgi:hypothetical protein